MDNNGTKGIAIVILLVLTAVFGCLPIWLHYRGSLSSNGTPRRKLILDVLNCFAGGIFLGTCLLHLLGEGSEEFEEYKQEVHYDSDFPFYETLVGVGIFLIAVVEKIGCALLALSKPKADDRVGESSKILKAGPGMGSSSPAWYGTTSQTPHNSPLETSFSVHEATKVQPTDPKGATQTSGGSGSKGSEWAERSKSDGYFSATTTANNGHDVKQRLVPKGSEHRQAHNCEELGEGKDHHHGPHDDHHHHHHDHDVPDISKMAAMRAFLLLMALSFHTLFDGLAVGLQNTVSGVWEVLLAIAIHKSLAAFCLGLQLASATPSNARRPALFMVLFSFISPIGIVIGMGVTSSGGTNEPAQLLVSSLLQALATGTFLYVTFFEILGHHFVDHHQHDCDSRSFGADMLKVFCAIVGFACMASIKLLDKE